MNFNTTNLFNPSEALAASDSHTPLYLVPYLENTCKIIHWDSVPPSLGPGHRTAAIQAPEGQGVPALCQPLQPTLIQISAFSFPAPLISFSVSLPSRRPCVRVLHPSKTVTACLEQLFILKAYQEVVRTPV